MSTYLKLPSAAPAAPAAPAAAPAAGGGNPLTANKNLLMVGGLVVVAVIALVNSRGKAEPTGTADDFEIDTRDTDLYNDLQPELEQIGDQLSRLQNPAPVKPPVTIPKPPVPPKPAPKPGPARNYTRYIVKARDTITSVAAAHRVAPGNLYAWNKGTIDAAAVKHGKRVKGTGTPLYVGSVLTIYTNLPGQRG